MHSEAGPRAALERRRTDADDTDEDVLEAGSCSELTPKSRVFKPLYLLSEWTEPLTNKACVTVAILLPSDVRKDTS